MEWTLSRFKPECNELLDQYLLTVGKALCIATHFDEKCKHILRVLRITDAIRAGCADDDVRTVALKNRRSTWKSLKLAQAIEEIGSADDVDDGDARILGAARLSRNYVAHDSAGLGPTDGATPQQIRLRATELLPHVMRLASGEWLVSAWSYENSEREPAPVDRDKYVAAVVAWVFGELTHQIDLPSGDSGSD